MGHVLDEAGLRAAATRLGPLPLSVQRLVAITATPSFEFADLVDVVTHDMSLSLAVMRRANSAASAPSTRIQSPRDAVMRIGVAATLATAMHTVVGNALSAPTSRYSFAPKELWAHSCGASIAADRVRVRATAPLPASVSTAALLHDIGKVVLDRAGEPAAGERGAGDHPIFPARGQALCDAEREWFGFDHAYAGAVVADVWDLSPAIAEGIERHHDPGERALPGAVCLAECIAHVAWTRLGEVPSPGVELPPEAEIARQSLGVPSAAIDEIVTSTAVELAALLGRFEPVG
jgi:HD-like signal output (HDOD) protein